jgi:putative transposase
MIFKTAKLRLYPNQAQERQIVANFGACRFVWNQLLQMQNLRHENGGTYVNEYGMNYLLKPLKKEYPWLKDSDSTSFLAVSHNLHLAFKSFFKQHHGYLKFKSKRRTRQAYRSNSVNGSIVLIDQTHIRLPKIGQVRFRSGQLPDGKIKTATVMRSLVGHYYALVTYEAEASMWSSTKRQVGLDIGVLDLVVTSDGQKFATQRFDKKLSRKKHYWERRYARRRALALKEIAWDQHNKVPVPRRLSDFKNVRKAQVMMAKYSEIVANQRRNYLHQISHELVARYDVIKIEDLKTKNLLNNHHLSRAIANQAWRELRLMLEYKAAWHGKKVEAVSPYKTSQICSNCGYDDGKHDLSVRRWICPQCGTTHDRDINAAKNILMA